MKTVRAALLPLLLVVAGTACSSKESATTDTGAAATSASSPEAPAAAPAGEPTANDVSNYKLDMDKMRKYVAAIKGFSALSASDSAAASAMGSGSANESTAQMIARIESNPVAVRVLRDAGLSPRDYVWITAAWLQAAMTQGIMESSAGAKLPEGQNPQNVEFLKANKTELERMMRDAGMSQ